MGQGSSTNMHKRRVRKRRKLMADVENDILFDKYTRPDTIEHTIDYLDPKSRAALGGVSRRLNDMYTQDINRRQCRSDAVSSCRTCVTDQKYTKNKPRCQYMCHGVQCKRFAHNTLGAINACAYHANISGLTTNLRSWSDIHKFYGDRKFRGRLGRGRRHAMQIDIDLEPATLEEFMVNALTAEENENGELEINPLWTEIEVKGTITITFGRSKYVRLNIDPRNHVTFIDFDYYDITVKSRHSGFAFIHERGFTPEIKIVGIVSETPSPRVLRPRYFSPPRRDHISLLRGRVQLATQLSQALRSWWDNLMTNYELVAASENIPTINFGTGRRTYNLRKRQQPSDSPQN